MDGEGVESEQGAQEKLLWKSREETVVMWTMVLAVEVESSRRWWGYVERGDQNDPMTLTLSGF